ncbi:antibiotic biosynthesis monooxygenase family protein [Pararhodospirillum photometricum]|uniref:Antibiotic biosynthesis monooxygenase n=1 Tax=Pararhodospirillum photometricum DSM 122 TaxID=1150469 RepID=H6SMU7_PARPM|nr:antibiotic biosynthesis monooxygenase [Pararhodospirillum photometricum]CCG09232.1 Antibiotic biosynthesis monooxygenase [Pararhodospirillum photometricum DSM 122]
MFVAMNRFKVLADQAPAFEAIWRGREGRLGRQPGFLSFHLLRGPAAEGHVLYVSHACWRTEADFEAWAHSEAFAAAHRNGGQTRALLSEGPQFEGFTVVLTEGEDGSA